ncbi:uncharacterized protein NECHADRAFT_89470, partial [Fusarium vanettenii 77-13-4]
PKKIILKKKLNLLLIGLFIDLTWPPWGSLAQLPEYLVDHTGKTTGIVPRDQICSAYEALIEVYPSYHRSPPLLYTLLSVPPPSDADTDIASHNARTNAILTALGRKTEPHYQAKASSSPGSTSRKKAQQAIDAWSKPAAVLLIPQVQIVYDTEVVGPVLEGRTVQKVLMREEMCGKRWAQNGKN